MRYKNSLFVLLVLFPLNNAYAKPMMSPTEDELCKADAIVEAEYTSYSSPGWFKSIDYFSPPIAHYKKTKQVSGEEVSENFSVFFDFQDGSACLKPPDWKFSGDMMPASGSKWILFLKKDEDSKTYRTYRGDFGRIPAADTRLLDHCKSILSEN